MSEIKEKLVHFVVEEDISSIQIMSRRLGINHDDVKELLNDLIGEGALIGYISKDGQRFFRHDLKQPDRTSKARDDYSPNYNGFDTRPGILIAIIGIITLALSGYSYASEQSLISSIAMLVGLMMLLVGCYCMSMQKSPI